jgi:hypothetical protein
MARPIAVTVAWMDPTTEEEFTVRARVTLYRDDAEVDVQEVVSDVTGLPWPALAVDLEESTAFRVLATEEAILSDRAAEANAVEARGDERREERGMEA